MRDLKKITIIILLLVFSVTAFSQQGSHRHVSEQLTEYADSLKNTPYTYVLPFMGKKVQAKGFDIPRPFGVMMNYTYTEMSILMNQLAISLDGITYTDVTEIVEFSKIRAHSNVVIVRPDVWIFPFWNVSGTVGYLSSNTDVVLDEPFDMMFLAKSRGPIAGIGTTLAGGVGPLFANYTFNAVWFFGENFLEPNLTATHGIRIGHHKRNSINPKKAYSVWVGAEYIDLDPATLGKVNLGELTGISPEDKQEAADELEDWYNDLPPPSQDKFGPIYDKVDEWLRNGETAILYYDFQKELETKWNFVIGGQYEFNKNFNVTAEGTFGGSRWRALLSLGYRFGF